MWKHSFEIMLITFTNNWSVHQVSCQLSNWGKCTCRPVDCSGASLLLCTWGSGKGKLRTRTKSPDNIPYRFVWLRDCIQGWRRDRTKAALYLGQAEGNNCRPLDETTLNWDGKWASELTLPNPLAPESQKPTRPVDRVQSISVDLPYHVNRCGVTFQNKCHCRHSNLSEKNIFYKISTINDIYPVCICLQEAIASFICSVVCAPLFCFFTLSYLNVIHFSSDHQISATEQPQSAITATSLQHQDRWLRCERKESFKAGNFIFFFKNLTWLTAELV